MTGSGSKQARAVVMLATASHRPFDTRIFHKEARTLVEHGYPVTLIIPRTDVPGTDVPGTDVPGTDVPGTDVPGTDVPGTDVPGTDVPGTDVPGTDVPGTDVPGTNSDEEYVSGVRLRSVRFPRHGAEKLLLTPLRILRKAWQEPRAAIIHIHDSELLFIGLLLRLSGRTVIYDAHEDTPLQIKYQHWLPRWAKPLYAGFYYGLEKLVGKTFNHIIVAEPIIQRYFPAAKTTLIHNFPIKTPFARAAQTASEEARESRAVYIGSITQVRGFTEMLEAVALARQQVDVTLVLAGGFHPATLQQQIADRPDVDYRGWVGLDELVDINFRSKIGLIVPHPVARYRTNLPVKVFEYMAAGLPVILAETSEAAQFLNECKGGILVNPLDPPQIAEAIVYLIRHTSEARAMGQRGQQLIFDKYHWESESRKLLALYASLNPGH